MAHVTLRQEIEEQGYVLEDMKSDIAYLQESIEYVQYRDRSMGQQVTQLTTEFVKRAT